MVTEAETLAGISEFKAISYALDSRAFLALSKPMQELCKRRNWLIAEYSQCLQALREQHNREKPC